MTATRYRWRILDQFGAELMGQGGFKSARMALGIAASEVGYVTPDAAGFKISIEVTPYQEGVHSSAPSPPA